jgi:hypothetical protein
MFEHAPIPRRMSTMSVIALVTSVAGAVMADTKIVHGVTCAWHNLGAPATYQLDGFVGSASMPLLTKSWAYCPLVRDNSTAEMSSITVRVYEANAGEGDKVACKLCTSNGTEELCTDLVSPTSNGVREISPNLGTIAAHSSQGYVVFCHVGPGSRVRSITYSEP